MAVLFVFALIMHSFITHQRIKKLNGISRAKHNVVSGRLN